MIKVAIIDDHPVVLKGLQQMLLQYSHIHVTGIYHNGNQLLEGLKHHPPDVLVLDIHMPGQNGIVLAEYIKTNMPDIQIVVLSNIDSLIQIKKILQYCLGYLLKDADETIIVKAIEKVYQHEQFLDSRLKERLINDMYKGKKNKDAALISRREKEVLRLITEGFTAPEIAKKLYLSTRTVENHRNNLLQKLDLKNSAELVKYAVEKGLI